MASLILLTKLDSLQRCLARIASKTPPGVEVLQKDLDLQDIIALNLERAVQICMNYSLQTADAAMEGVSRDGVTAVPWLVPSQKSPSRNQRSKVLAAFSSRPEIHPQEQRWVRSERVFLTSAPQT
jgi:hypothetical protein